MSAHRAALLMALQHARILAPLNGWPPCGGLLQAAIEAANGYGSFSSQDCRRLQRWAIRWEAVPSRYQEFYSEHSSERCISAALWHLFGAYPRPEGAVYGQMVALWVHRYGYTPGFSLVYR